MMVEPDGEPAIGGTYIIFAYLDHDAMLSVGRLGHCTFPAGYYAYVGSARGPGGLKARLARHLRAVKRARWHIDYLLEVATVVEIWQASSTERLECKWAEALQGLPPAAVPVAGFGSSDCACHAHLCLFQALPSLEAFRSQLSSMGLDVSVRRRKLGVLDEDG